MLGGGGQIPIIAIHTSITSPTSTSHVGDKSPTSTSNVGSTKPTSVIHVGDLHSASTSHVGGIDIVENPKRIGCKQNFPCNIFKGYHLTHFFPGI
jgi:hypothetical protein